MANGGGGGTIGTYGAVFGSGGGGGHFAGVGVFDLLEDLQTGQREAAVWGDGGAVRSS